MKLLTGLKKNLPAPINLVLAVLSAILLISAFPGFEFWFLAFISLVPLFFAVTREKKSLISSFVLGWIFGIVFFFGSCWWLTYAPITYAKFPAPLAYFLLLCATFVVGIFPAVFCFFFSVLIKRFGTFAIFSASFLWTAIEFSRFWITGNNWNAIAYSQAFHDGNIQLASIGGIYLVGFEIVFLNSILAVLIFLFYRFFKLKKSRRRSIGYILFSIFGGSQTSSVFKPFFPASFDNKTYQKFVWRYKPSDKIRLSYILLIFAPVIFFFLLFFLKGIFGIDNYASAKSTGESLKSNIIAVQPNVPMSGLTEEKWLSLRKEHVRLAENALQKLDEQQTTNNEQPTTVIFPESPMNFMYERDEEFQKFVGDFAKKNNVSVLFNSAEPDLENKSFFNSAVLVNTEGRKIAQYDKIYLVPFGESVPAPLQNFLPALVGSFSYGKEYDLLPFGDARGGVMICFESHFPNLSREYVRRGADVLVEMTNDGYLGNTPVLRQHLANAVFRAVETARPVLRVTNVGVTAYINERGEISDAAEVYTEATRTWKITKSNGGQTFYVRYGDWFAWLCVIVSFGLLVSALRRRKI